VRKLILYPTYSELQADLSGMSWKNFRRPQLQGELMNGDTVKLGVLSGPADYTKFQGLIYDVIEGRGVRVPNILRAWERSTATV
jgi:hypothetical protein